MTLFLPMIDRQQYVLDAKHKAMQKNLQAKSGTAFDAAYIKGQIADHKATIALLEREIASGKDAQTKAFATDPAGCERAFDHVANHEWCFGKRRKQGWAYGIASHMAPGSGAGSQMNPGANVPAGTGAQSPAGAPLGTATP